MPSFKLRVVFGLAIAALIVGGPLWYVSYHQRKFRNFHVVEEGVLYRAAQLPIGGLKRLIHDYQIKTVVSLRDGEKANDLEEEAYLDKDTACFFVRIPPRPWSAPDGSVPAEIGIQQFREVMDNPANYPVLVHCFAGIHRTGAVCAIYRMDYDGWTNEEAMAEMERFGYTAQHMDVLPYMRAYQSRHITPGGTPRPNLHVQTVSHQKAVAP